jgi:hypothetical protein
MKVRVNRDEMYPVYFESHSEWPGDVEIELTEDEYNKWHAVSHSFETMQQLLSKRYKEGT